MDQSYPGDGGQRRRQLAGAGIGMGGVAQQCAVPEQAQPRCGEKAHLRGQLAGLLAAVVKLEGQLPVEEHYCLADRQAALGPAEREHVDADPPGQFLGGDIQGRNGHMATGTLIARKESGIKTIADMKGKTLLFGPALAPFGYMAQYSMMLENGLDPETDLARYDIPPGSLKHDKIMYGVEYGKYDVGAAPRIDLDRMAADDIINLDDYNIIAESEKMPYCTIGAAAHVDKGLQEKVKNILLNLKKDETALVDGEVLKVLKRMGLDGFHPAIDKEYDIIRDKLRRNNMAPYDKH